MRGLMLLQTPVETAGFGQQAPEGLLAETGDDQLEDEQVVVEGHGLLVGEGPLDVLDGVEGSVAEDAELVHGRLTIINDF